MSRRVLFPQHLTPCWVRSRLEGMPSQLQRNGGCAPRDSVLCDVRHSPSPNGFGAIVDAYIRDYREEARREVRFFARQRSLRDAIDLAARCVLPSGKRHPHQRRIPGAALESARARLLKANLGRCRDFDELHEQVRTAITDIRMIGPLVVYDVAHRIGMHLGIEPERVHLHAGTRKGARALGLGRGRDSLQVSELPRELRRLSAAELEDCLCIYKTDFQRLTERRAQI